MEYQSYMDANELLSYNMDELDDESYSDLFSDDPIDDSNWSFILWQFASCAKSVLWQSYWQLCFPLLLCLLWRFISSFGKQFMDVKSAWFATSLHLVSIMSGLVLINHFFGDNLTILIRIIMYLTFFFATSLRFGYLYNSKIESLLIVGICLGTQLYCEFFIDPIKWHKIRGSVMIVIMKAISFPSTYRSSLDKQSLLSNNHTTPIRNHWIYQSIAWLSYALCPASVIFGPWFDFASYEQSVWTSSIDCKAIISSLMHSLRSLSIALFCLIYSTCSGLTLFPEMEYSPWCNAYLASQSFRFSHYFVSFASESTIAAFGLGTIHITHPLSIEFPRSLVEVVVQWSLPMHMWLKQYVYKPLRPYGQIYAVLGTYMASSLLHGLNFQLGAVLLSIGIYAYIEYHLRDKLSHKLDACIGSRSCPAPVCEHKYKDRFWVRCINLGFTGLALFHLSYLAVMFDTSEDQVRGYSMKHALIKWSELNFSSHFIALMTFILYKIL